jgi:hypothetical protein
VSDLIFDIPTLIETISAGITLEPGDIIATGTPAGVGIGFDPPASSARRRGADRGAGHRRAGEPRGMKRRRALLGGAAALPFAAPAATALAQSGGLPVARRVHGGRLPARRAGRRRGPSGGRGAGAALAPPVPVVNRPGASGELGNASVARAAPDGYTLLMALSSLAVLPEAARLFGRAAGLRAGPVRADRAVHGRPDGAGGASIGAVADGGEFVAAAKARPGQSATLGRNYSALHVPWRCWRGGVP